MYARELDTLCIHAWPVSKRTAQSLCKYVANIFPVSNRSRHRNRFENQLTAEREATLRYKGENGIMKKKFTVLTKDIEDQKVNSDPWGIKYASLELQVVSHSRRPCGLARDGPAV